MLFSKQIIYCNACGCKFQHELPNVYGIKFKCCSMDCVKEMQWRETLSILGKEYYQNPNKKDYE